jgi:hypothetical protein
VIPVTQALKTSEVTAVKFGGIDVSGKRQLLMNALEFDQIDAHTFLGHKTSLLGVCHGFRLVS